MALSRVRRPMSRTSVHPTALVAPDATLADGVSIGPYSVIGECVTIGAGTSVGPHTVIEGPVRIGKNNRISGQSSIGSPPQDLKYKGEVTWLEIGDDNTIREFVTL